MRLFAVFLVTALLFGTLAGVSNGRAGLPEGCEPDGSTFTCRWTFDTREDPWRSEYAFDIPHFPRTLARVTVVLDGQDNGWAVQVNGLDPGAEGEPRKRTVSQARHTPQNNGATVHSETSAHLLLPDLHAVQSYELEIEVQSTMASGFAVNSGARSLGEFRVIYVAEPMQEGVQPARPAATRADPHVQDVTEDARRPEFDVQAAWMDDARLGDGLMEVHVAVASLENLDFNASAANEPFGRLAWDFEFRVEDTNYRVYWNAYERGPRAPFWECRLTEQLGTGTKDLMNPACPIDVRNGTLTAVFPVASVGNPGNGVLFTRLRADACSGFLVCTNEDVADNERYPFALGGPAVWDELNPRLAVAPLTPLAWYQDPVSRENLPDTLQVLGALFAAGTFLVGAVLVRRHRRLTRRLLAEVSRVRETQRTDARAALLALGRLQEHVSGLYHKGRITESQHQVVSQRIAFEATQFALRRDLGLDDGEPGETPARVDA